MPPAKAGLLLARSVWVVWMIGTVSLES